MEYVQKITVIAGNGKGSMLRKVENPESKSVHWEVLHKGPKDNDREYSTIVTFDDSAKAAEYLTR